MMAVVLWMVMVILVAGTVGFAAAAEGAAGGAVAWAFVMGLLCAVAIQQIGLAVKKGSDDAS